MRILITGASGFLGSKLLLHLLSQGYTISILLRKDLITNDTIQGYINSNSLTTISLNTVDWKLKVLEFNPNIVIHLAAYLTSSDNEESISKLVENNILFGCQLLDALRQTDFKYFINTGTFAEYKGVELKPNPSYLYAATKTAFRSFLKYYQNIKPFKIINVIPYTIYGAKDSKKKLIDYIYTSLNSKVAIDMSPGEQILDFIHIDDVLEFYKKLLLNLEKFDEHYTELHVGSSKGSTPKKIAALIEKLTNKKTNINWGGLDYRLNDTMHSVANVKMAMRMINWKPSISLERGIDMYIKHMKDNGF